MSARVLATLAAAGVWLATVATPTQAQPKKLWISGSDAGYVQGGACDGCHGEIASSYARTGMARSFGRMRGDTPFAAARYRHAASEQSFSTYRRDGKAYLERTIEGPDGSPALAVEREIHYWFGSGNHARSFFHQTGDGRFVQLPLTWYSGGGWAMSPGYDRADHSGFSRKVNYRCLFCHAGYPEIEPGAGDWDGGSRFPGVLTEGIDCQRCHGPGRTHIAAARGGRPPQQVRSTIVNPARLPPDRKTEVCLQCHLETTTLRLPSSVLRLGRGVFSYRPGEPLADYILYFDHAQGSGHDGKFEFVSEAYRMRQSACFVKSQGELTCTTCHNPHDIPRGAEATARYAAVCMGCHGQTISEQGKLGHHPESRDCAGCHMPKRRPSDAMHVRVADHRILRRPAVESPVEPPPVEHNDANSPPYRGAVQLYYPPELPDTPGNSLHIAIAQVRHQSNLEIGLPALDALVSRLNPSHPGFYLEAGEAWRNLGRADKALEYHEEAARRRSGDWRYVYALGLSLARTGQIGRAIGAFQRAAALAPFEPAIPQAMGESLNRTGRPREAAEAFRKAIAADGDFAEAHNNLGTSLLRLGDGSGAERAFRQAVLLRPEVAGIRVNLASFLARSGRFPEAAHHFESVLRVHPGFADGHSAYGTALAAQGRQDEALAHYEAALRLNPALPITHNNLATILAQRGRVEEAIRAYREAIRYAPDYFEAHWKLGELLVTHGNRAEGEQHLRKAATSPDPRIRDAAGRLLR